jgi:hypothetical protein
MHGFKAFAASNLLWPFIFISSATTVTSIEDIKSLARDGLSGDEYLKKLWWLMPDDNGNGGHLSAIHKYLAEYPNFYRVFAHNTTLQFFISYAWL